jgi:hypothetical protein
MKMRHRLRLPLHCPVMFASDEFIGEGTVIDLGVRGCAVHSDGPPMLNDYLRLHIFPADEEGPFEVRLGKVRWAEPSRFGVEFLAFFAGHDVTVRRLFQAFENGKIL